MTEAEFFACLRAKYDPREYALFPQVRNATGAGASRTADALAVSLWPSRRYADAAHRGRWESAFFGMAVGI